MTSNAMPPFGGDLSVSIVVYQPDETLLAQTMSSLAVACAKVHEQMPSFRSKLYLVDNGGLGTAADSGRAVHERGVAYSIVSGHGNVGYGRGHNLAIAQTTSRYHLVLNPDVDIAPESLFMALAFLDAQPQVGLLTPGILSDEGQLQYLCRRPPAVLDLLVRGFAPAGVRQRFAERLAHYEMRDVINDHDVVWDPPIVSGCFMLFRTEVLKKLRGFDPRYFLYFEDYDLSLRTHEVAHVAYVPSVRVIHHGGGASRKGFKHIRMFAASAFKFYNRFGWRWR
ncbi:glycosyltransferase [Burkholderia dolosa]|uniref:glycosyltransferase n=1 Tax=Burkholderia dolosa TaxID=152500 RepID=UPI001BA2ED7A|nr:glycosyltransferase [Burkholderia dolosa]MBR8299987.1 glycosyltransferase [Burkholderia dolosa]MDN7447437.1 glycosyltransferase [Burkholderia multivorans]